MSLLNVVCVLKSGGVYDAEYVERLQSGVKKHLPRDHRFMCLSDVPVPCERIPLKHEWPGWWSKMEIYRLPEPVLFFDLDTIITGDLSDIAKQAQDWEFTLLRDFHRPEGLGSGLMGWNVNLRRLYDKFATDVDGWRAKFRGAGDQGFVEQNVNLNGVARWQDRLPGQVVSYKVHVRQTGKVPDGARVCCFHGKPKPRDVKWTI